LKILVAGSGGREHALAWHLKKCCSKGPEGSDKIFVWPGNAGMSKIAIPVEKVSNISDLLNYVKEKEIEWTVIGPEAYLAGGIVDIFNENELNIFGPTKDAAMLESSKDYAKAFLTRHDIPTAGYRTFSSFSEGIKYLRGLKNRIVLKADGLAAGKGVFIPEDNAQAEKILEELLEGGRLGEAGAKVIVEDHMEGQELSYMIFTDGKHFKPLAGARDFKRLLDGDRGPNTGGMGVYSPSPVLTEELSREINYKIVYPVIEGLKKEKIDYRGVLYIGLFITADGPKVCEFNVRFGDPETQAVLMRLNTPLVEIFEAVKNRTLDRIHIDWKTNFSGGVVLASPGYPGEYEKDIEIKIPDTGDDVTIFHAGTVFKGGKLLSKGGRVLNVMAEGSAYSEVFKKVYSTVEKIDFKGKVYRKDICPVKFN